MSCRPFDVCGEKCAIWSCAWCIRQAKVLKITRCLLHAQRYLSVLVLLKNTPLAMPLVIYTLTNT